MNSTDIFGCCAFLSHNNLKWKQKAGSCLTLQACWGDRMYCVSSALQPLLLLPPQSHEVHTDEDLSPVLSVKVQHSSSLEEIRMEVKCPSQSCFLQDRGRSTQEKGVTRTSEHGRHCVTIERGRERERVRERERESEFMCAHEHVCVWVCLCMLAT